MNLRLPAWLTLLAAALFLAGCGREPQDLTVEVVDSHPHDPGAFTQGLLYYQGRLFESTGLEGRSSVREVDLESGEVLRLLDLAPELFGEGLARVDDHLIQITWRNGRAFRYDLETFAQEARFSYRGEGWGLCYDGKELYMSDGSSTLAVRDPVSFAVLRTVSVRFSGEPVELLNELECVGGEIYANIWLTDLIVRIDKRSGQVTAQIDASPLLTPEERAALPQGAVLNGIAYNPESESFYLTGKLWPRLFEVRFRPGEP